MPAATAFMDGGQTEAGRRELEAGAALLDGPGSQAIHWERAGNALLESGWKREAASCFRKALQLHRSVDGTSSAVAFTLLQLCRTDFRKHVAEAEEAVAIYRDIEGDQGIETAGALVQLAYQLYYRSQYDRAEARCRAALKVVEQRAPDGQLAVQLYSVLGLALFNQGDFEAARKAFHRELESARRVAPQGPELAYAYNHLGLIAKNLGNYRAARSWYLRALTIYRSCRPGGIEVAGMLNNLGNLAMKQEDFAGALGYHEEALEIRERLHPGGADVAASLNNLGSAERQMGKLGAAREHLERALEIKRAKAPGTWTLANTLTELGMTATAQERFQEAGRLFAEAREIRERVAPGNPGAADIVFLQGTLARRRGRMKECERLWRRAIAITESIEGDLPLSEHELSRFGARFYLFYGALARLLVERGQNEEAFTLMERARARALRSMLVGAQSVPPGVPARLWSSYRQVLRKIERARTEQARLVSASPDALDSSGPAADIRRLVTRRDRLRQEILAVAPRLGKLAPATAPSIDEVRRALEPGTLILSYVVGEEQTVLFVLGDSASGIPLRTFSIPVGSSELERRVGILHAFIARGRDDPTIDDALVTQARKLFQLLVEPARAEIEPSRRLLIVPDGPLREAPFSALVLPGERLTFLGVWKPLFFDPSAGAFLALKARRGEGPGGTGIVAFGDPEYPSGSSTVRALRLGPLEGSRREVQRIAARFGEETQLFLGSQATEERLRSLRGGVRYLHLAVHARSDARFPLESALLFSMGAAPGAPPGRDGVLHAWEIMDGLHLDADVITLSGCSTGCGERVAGEGVLGLARAFQYAGARTVVAAQWPVDDRATCELMDRFYSELVEGAGTAETLRHAQEIMASAPLRLESGEVLDLRHPFHWAAFQVIGCWR